jgi:hypothetical protein
VPIIGWLQILVVIALSELWRYERLGDKSPSVEMGKIRGNRWENHGKTLGKPWENDGNMLENYGRTMGKLWEN